MKAQTTPDRAKAEWERLAGARERGVPWRKWGQYLSERQWGAIREDYSENGDAWDYFTHDQARSRAYRWGEVLDRDLTIRGIDGHARIVQDDLENTPMTRASRRRAATSPSRDFAGPGGATHIVQAEWVSTYT